MEDHIKPLRLIPIEEIEDLLEDFIALNRMLLAFCLLLIDHLILNYREMCVRKIYEY